MKSDIKSLTDIFEGKKQIRVPIYQRGYSWTRDECRQLFNDIMRIGVKGNDGKKTHFIGTVVCARREHIDDSTKKYDVVDGQQRLATILLLINAWCNVYRSSESKDDNRDKEAYETYLVNRFSDGDNNRYKMMVTNADENRITFEHLIGMFKKDSDVEKLPANYSKSIMSAHKFFMEMLVKPGIDLNSVFAGIEGLRVAFTEVIYGEDDVQEIFESLNTTGMKLSNADLVRNFVLMGLKTEEQEALHNPYWIPIERVFKENPIKFDEFIYNFLLLKVQNTNIGMISKKRTYNTFKSYVREQKNDGKNIMDILLEIGRYAEYYRQIRDREYGDTANGQRLTNAVLLDNLDLGVAYPLLFRLFDEYDSGNGRLSIGSLIETLNIIEIYLFRRKVCSMTNPQRSRFVRMKNGIADNGTHVNNLKRMLGENQRKNFPGDSNFVEDFVRMDAYKLASYILEKIESHNSMKKVKEGLTVEHVMPQKLTDEWRQHLGRNHADVYARMLNTIGNLTLMTPPKNVDAGNKNFETKKGFYHDDDLWINESIINRENWNEQSMRDRAQMFVERAVQVWPYPLASSEPIMKDLKEIGFLSKFEENIVITFENLRDEILERFHGTTVKTTSHYIGFYRGAPKLFCGICKWKGALWLTYPTRDDEFEADNSFVTRVPDKPMTNMKNHGDHMSRIENDEDVSMAIDVLSRMYPNSTKNE